MLDLEEYIYGEKEGNGDERKGRRNKQGKEQRERTGKWERIIGKEGWKGRERGEGRRKEKGEGRRKRTWKEEKGRNEIMSGRLPATLSLSQPALASAPVTSRSAASCASGQSGTKV